MQARFPSIDIETNDYLTPDATFKAILTFYNGAGTRFHIKDYGEHEAIHDESEHIDAEKARYESGRGSIVPSKISLNECKRALLRIAYEMETAPHTALFTPGKNFISVEGTHPDTQDYYRLRVYLKKVSNEFSLLEVTPSQPPESSIKKTQKRTVSQVFKHYLHSEKKT